MRLFREYAFITQEYAQSYLTLVSTRNYEGTSLSAIESMAVGTPVISTAIGGLKDLPTIKALANPQSLVEKIIWVNKNYQKISKYQTLITREIFNLKNWGGLDGNNKVT